MNHADAITALGGPAVVARGLGQMTNTVVHWKRRGSIPAAFWRRVAELPGAADAGVTIEELDPTAAKGDAA